MEHVSNIHFCGQKEKVAVWIAAWDFAEGEIYASYSWMWGARQWKPSGMCVWISLQSSTKKINTLKTLRDTWDEESNPMLYKYLSYWSMTLGEAFFQTGGQEAITYPACTWVPASHVNRLHVCFKTFISSLCVSALLTETLASSFG